MTLTHTALSTASAYLRVLHPRCVLKSIKIPFSKCLRFQKFYNTCLPEEIRGRCTKGLVATPAFVLPHLLCLLDQVH